MRNQNSSETCMHHYSETVFLKIVNSVKSTLQFICRFHGSVDLQLRLSVLSNRKSSWKKIQTKKEKLKVLESEKTLSHLKQHVKHRNRLNHCVKSVRIRYTLRIHSKCGKMLTRITTNTDTFHAVNAQRNMTEMEKSWKLIIACSKLIKKGSISELTLS